MTTNSEGKRTAAESGRGVERDEPDDFETRRDRPSRSGTQDVADTRRSPRKRRQEEDVDPIDEPDEDPPIRSVDRGDDLHRRGEADPDQPRRNR